MKSIWMLAAVASLAACAGRGEDDMGAAPDRGDTTAVTTGADTTQWDTTNTGGVGQTAEPGMVPDTSAANDQAEPTEQYPTTPGTTTDTVGQSGAYPTDTTSAAGETTNPSGGYDTTAVPGATDTSTSVPSADPGMNPDTSSTGTSGMSTDSTAIEPTVPDSAATPQ
ncbi:MAG TPA: hypothetical protein VFT84_09790 [Gemmatimonadales bacterium]|nr:hypothetical protein [Gemmatimonadales bacterium]